MNKKQEILNKLKDLGKTEPVLIPALVKSVDETELTAIIEINELEFKCRLSAAEGSVKGCLIVPEVGSWVIAGRLDENGDVYVIAGFSAVSKIILMNGENGGLAIVSDLVSQLNKIEDDINSLKQVFTSWVTVPQDGGAALKTASAAWTAQTLVKTTDSDIENENILH